MINQIRNTNNNVYAPLRSSGAPFAIVKPFTPAQKQEVEVEKEKKSNAFGYGIAVSAMVVGFGVFAALKGFSKGSRHSVNKLFRKLANKTTTLDKNKNKSVLQSIYYGVLKVAKEVTKRSRTLFNAAPLKDAAAMHYIEKVPTLKRWSDSITKYFEKISVKTSKRAYRVSSNKFETMFADFAEASKKLPKEQADIVNSKIKVLRDKHYNGFSEAAQNERLIETKADMDGIGKEVYNATWQNPMDFAKDAVAGTFVSEEKASFAKIKLSKKVSKLKDEISISPEDNYNSTKRLLNNIYDFVDQAEENPRNIMDKLKKGLKNYKKSLESGTKAEEAFPESDIAKNLKDLEEYFKNSTKYDNSTKNSALEYIKDINLTLTNKNKEGTIQEIMDIFKANLKDKNDFNKLNKSVNKTLKSFNHAIDMETDKLFDKVRDLLIGAAPVDVLGVISSLGVIVWGLAKAENSDERTSAALKFGIPAVGAVAISLYCTVGLIAGGPSLIIGLVSGALINKLGVVVDDMRKKYKEKPPTLSIPDPTKILPNIKQNMISVQNKSAL